MKNLTKITLISLATLTALSMGAWAECSADVDMGGHTISNVANPSAKQDVVTKDYVDKLLSQLTVEHLYMRDDESETVTDITTGLIWQDNPAVVDESMQKQWLTDEKYDNCLEAIDQQEELERCKDTSGDTAATYCEILSLGDYNDWRLPTRDELRGIVKNGVERPSISLIFRQVISDSYWSSQSSSNSAGSVDFTNGYYYDFNKNASHYVRCVRNGQ